MRVKIIFVLTFMTTILNNSYSECPMNQFSITTSEQLQYYVYVLADPRTEKIFYVGKGFGSRVFAHVACAIENDMESNKLNTIRAIHESGNQVRHYIVRHGLTEREAFIVESVLIDLLTCSEFPSVANISNIVAGHHQWDKGIKTVEEVELLYACRPLLEENIAHNIMTINVNKTYNIKSDYHPDIYEATRKSWKLNGHRAKQTEYVLSEYRGVIRAIFRPVKWIKDGDRWIFEGEEVTDKAITDLYLHKSVPPKRKGAAYPIRYFSKQ